MVISISIEQLIMSDNEISKKIGFAGEERMMKIYISDGGDPIFNNRNSNDPVPYSRIPAQWQYDFFKNRDCLLYFALFNYRRVNYVL